MMSCCDTGTKLLACDWFAKHLLRQARISPESERLIRTGTDLDATGRRLVRAVPGQNDSSVQERI